MASKKTIAVVGATGTQGSSVVKHFLTLPDWHVRCLTRNTTSANATNLSSLGAQVVQADLNDVDSLRQAFSGAHVIFLNTDFWATYVSLKQTQGVDAARDAGLETEIRHATNAANAAQATDSLERLIYSALGPM